MEQYEILQERIMIVAISNLIKIANSVVLLNLFLGFPVYSDQMNDLKDSFFPLIPGSYWVTQDTFFYHDDEVAAQEGGMNPFTTKTDSVKQIISTSNGLKIQMLSRLGKKRKDEVCFEYFIDKSGYISEISIDNKLIKSTASQWKLFPQKGDTVFESGSLKRILSYDTINSDNVITLLPKWESKNPACEPSFFLLKKGIGLIGQIYPTTANRLIEYRIGNGPIVKKRWIMEAPKGK